ncbi:hypothetical protein R1sor_007580 [Riccia sorocarpa]|uniref:Reverse transcriptase n=1 Tax=Riccia sorocarpa TaxID=122646 RepID=A0ABD3HUB0_9MARC
MEVAGPQCLRCSEGTENLEHMFLQCRKVRSNRQTLMNLHARATGEIENRETSLIKGTCIIPVKVILLEMEKMVDGLAKNYTSEETSRKLEDTAKGLALMGALNQHLSTERTSAGPHSGDRNYHNPHEDSSGNEDYTRRLCRRNAHKGNRARERYSDRRHDIEYDLNSFDAEDGLVEVWDTMRALELLGFQEITLVEESQLDARELVPQDSLERTT